MPTHSIYDDGDYTQALRVTLPVLSAPIPGVNTKYVLTEDWIQFAANYSPLALNTAYPNTASGGNDAYTSFLLVEESMFKDLENGVVQWTRTYAKVPDHHTQPGQVSYRFIGFARSGFLPFIYREPFTKTVPAQIEYDYFLLTSSGTNAMLDLEKANFVQEQPYLWPRLTVVPLPDSALRTDYITDTNAPPTQPTLAEYGTWVSSGTHPIVAQASAFDRWRGNIIERQVVKIFPE